VTKTHAQILASLLLLSLAAIAAPKWEFLGEANVDGAIDHDTIRVTGAKGAFRAIQIRVVNGAIRFDRVVVHFANGSSEPIAVRARINAGGQTRAIDLPGERRVIESVEFWYQRGNWRSLKPQVRLWGIR